MANKPARKKVQVKLCRDCDRFNTDACRNRFDKSCYKPDVQMLRYIMLTER